MLAGGAENMSQTPYAVRDMRFGTAFGTDYKVRKIHFFLILFLGFNTFQKGLPDFEIM